MMMSWTTFAMSLLLAATTACKSADKSSGAAPASGLAWQPDPVGSTSPACKKALACCEAQVKDEKPSPKPSDYNLACSGAAMLKTDTECDAFTKGYVDEFTVAKKPVPAECK